jgi:hypothetical protein
MENKMETITFAEIAAYQLLYGSNMITKTEAQDFHNAGDKIIMMAEKIKAERAVVAMNK